jgi:uncharacterized protein
MSDKILNQALPGLQNLQHLLGSMQPLLSPMRYAFCTISRDVATPDVIPVATVEEAEGKTLVVEFDEAVRVGLEPVGEWAMLTMQVHSSLEAVGFIAAIATTLAEKRISANVMSGFYHDHVFVQWSMRHDAVVALEELAANQRER